MTENIYETLKKKILTKDAKLAIMGMGYVGLPLAVEFSKIFDVIGYDISEDAIAKITHGRSYITGISDETIQSILKKSFLPSTDSKLLSEADFIIICVPTPLQKDKTPELKYIKSASVTISQHLRKGQFVILESTTLPEVLARG